MREMEEDGKYWMEVVELSKAVKSRVELKKEGSKDAAQRSHRQSLAAEDLPWQRLVVELFNYAAALFNL